MTDIDILVPSLGILLFNNGVRYEGWTIRTFSSPLWGFFYLMELLDSLDDKQALEFSSPLWGFFYLILS